ncbi:MAG TPA: phenylalanine--tRNA ligase subunit beta [Acidimicrobiales bacterium]|jgi:phenylalanyl-tRNA synthetase beta chain|nr:phenylalanine--tRNA ligase subunit beta [Acidimicrobiales bacterium]
MKVLLSWLREFAPIEGSPDEIAEVLSDLGLAVEEQRVVGEGLDGIVVARVEGLRPHPNADKIQLVDVDPGRALRPEGEATLQICCGAFNMAVGDLVPLATLGTTMPGGMKIERRKLRGEWSNGMLCSAAELDLSHEGAGILILQAGVEPGEPVAGALGIGSDVLYDLEVNPNRPDAMSVAGVARDLAARLGVPFNLPTPEVRETAAGDAGAGVHVEIVDPEGCGRFTAKILRNVTVGQSPAWMASRLTLLGMRPINALVDISNYVMLELGQPNHPYDLDLVANGTLRVRRAAGGERLTTLDDVERELDPADLLICDGDDRAVGIAGVMGGASCEIHDGTTRVLVENAWFLPIAVAKTGRRLGLRTEASARFEKGTDPEVIDVAAARFCQLAQEICGAEVVEGMVDARGSLPHRPPVAVRPDRVNALLGTELSPDQMKELLDPIGFTTTVGADGLTVEIPPWRYDSETEIDVVEEVARLYGYSRIPATVPTAARFGELTTRQLERRQVRRVLAGLGLSEAMPLSFLAPGDLVRAGLPDDGIALLNPLVADESILRTSLRPGLLKAVAHNTSHRNTGVGLWEIGHVIGTPPAGQLLPDEREHLAVALSGQEAPAAVEVWHVLAEALAVGEVDLANTPLPGLHAGRSAAVSVGGEVIGAVGEVAPEVLDAFEIPERVAWLEVDLGRLQDLPHGDRTYRLVSKFPSSDLDLAFEVADEVSALAVAATIRSTGELVQSVELFDVFRGAQVGEGRRSLAYRVRLQAPDRTLDDRDLATARDQLVAAVEQTHGATLRA